MMLLPLTQFKYQKCNDNKRTENTELFTSSSCDYK